MWLTLICQRASGLFATVSRSRPVGVHLSSRGSWHSRAAASRKVARTNRGSSKTHWPSTKLTKDTEEEWRERLIIYYFLVGLKFNQYQTCFCCSWAYRATEALTQGIYRYNKPHQNVHQILATNTKSDSLHYLHIGILKFISSCLCGRAAVLCSDILWFCDVWNNLSRAAHCD